MTENIFEELVREARNILGSSFEIKVKANGCDFRFSDVKEDSVRQALQETVSFVMAGTELKLKKFAFEDKDLRDLGSLTSVLVKLTCAWLNSLHPEKKDPVVCMEHFWEYKQCRRALLDTLAFFTSRLTLTKKKWRRPFLRFFKNLFGKIFGSKKKNKKLWPSTNINVILPLYLSSLSLIFGTKSFLNSEEKMTVFKKYAPSLTQKNVSLEKVFDVMAGRAMEKEEDLTAEEIEEILKELIQ